MYMYVWHSIPKIHAICVTFKGIIYVHIYIYMAFFAYMLYNFKSCMICC